MPAPIGTDPYLKAYLDELEGRIEVLENPKSPPHAFACTKATLPDALRFMNCVARVTDTNILVASDGVHWIRQDTGAPI